MGILQTCKTCLYLSNRFIIHLAAFISISLVSCNNTETEKNTGKTPCPTIPKIIKMEIVTDTLRVGNKLYGKIIFNKNLDDRIQAEVLVLGKKIYFNRDTTQFEFTPQRDSLCVNNMKAVVAEIHLKYIDCIDTTIYLNQQYVLFCP